jgi:hypothetical protein
MVTLEDNAKTWLWLSQVFVPMNRVPMVAI